MTGLLGGFCSRLGMCPCVNRGLTVEMFISVILLSSEISIVELKYVRLEIK